MWILLLSWSNNKLYSIDRRPIEYLISIVHFNSFSFHQQETQTTLLPIRPNMVVLRSTQRFKLNRMSEILVVMPSISMPTGLFIFFTAFLYIESFYVSWESKLKFNILFIFKYLYFKHQKLFLITNIKW